MEHTQKALDDEVAYKQTLKEYQSVKLDETRKLIDDDKIKTQ